MGVYQTRWVLLALLMIGGCDPADRTRDAGLRGPPDGVLMFDPSMLIDANSVDARISPRDAGGFVRVDAALPVSDAGRRQRCGGVALPCAGSGAACGSTLGCRASGMCSGLAYSCFSISSSFSCASQQGCLWNSSRRQCNGGAYSCREMRFASACFRQQGCDWMDTCEGTPVRCSSIPNSTCATQPGCSLVWE